MEIITSSGNRPLYYPLNPIINLSLLMGRLKNRTQHLRISDHGRSSIPCFVHGFVTLSTPLFEHLEEAKHIWDSLKIRYSVPNRPRVCKLWSNITTLSQHGSSVAVFYTKLLALWGELLTLSPLGPCGCEKSKEQMNWIQDLQVY